MKAANVLVMSRLFLRYFVRKALSAGILQSRLARILLGVVILGGAAVMSVLSTVVLGEILPGRRELLGFLQMSTISVVSWTLIAFLFVKVLFMKSDGLLQCTLLLPVSHRERSAALALYEFVMVGASVGGALLPIIIASLVRLGPDAVPSLLTGIVMTASSGYLVLSVLHNAVARALEAFGGSRLTHVVTLPLMASLTLWYNGMSVNLIGEMIRDYSLGGIEFHVVDLFLYLQGRLGWPAASAAFLALSAVMIVLAVVTAPVRSPIHRHFIKVAVPFPENPLWVSVVALVRRTDWWVSLAVAYVLAAMLWLGGGTQFVFAALVPLSQGIYVYAATNPLRLMPGYRRSAGSEVWHMLLGQAIAAVIPAVPIAVLALARPETWDGFRFVDIALASGVILTTLVSIVFVAENDSPLVVFTGYAVCFVAFASIAVMVSLLQVPGPWLWVGAASAHVLAVVYAVVGMKHITSRKRHETAATHS